MPDSVTYIEGQKCLLRPWRDCDAEPLVPLANNRNVWRNVGDIMPYPYSLEAARSYIASAYDESRTRFSWAVEANGRLVGAAAIAPGAMERRFTASLGYWVGEPFWGRGLGTDIVSLLTRFGFDFLPAERIQALVYAWNPASARVLEKNRYVLESTQPRAIFKDDTFVDAWIYAKLNEH